MNRRVMVFDGDAETPLGLGTIVGYVTVYAWMNQEGHLCSYQVAEDPQAAVGREDVTVIPKNAKIKLDSGRIVYGCQVWWRPISKGVEINE